MPEFLPADDGRPGVPAEPPRPGGLAPIAPLGPGTLGRRLVVRMAALVAVVAVVLSTLTTLSTRQTLERSVDRQLETAFSRQDKYPKGGISGSRPAPPLTLSPSLPIGTIVMVSDGKNFAANMRVDRNTPEDTGNSLSDPDTRKLLSLPPNGKHVSVRLPQSGHYRALAVNRDGLTYLVALPLAELDKTIAEMIIFELILSLLAIGLSILVVRTVVIRSLKPLNRLAGTAQQVSQLELSRGEVELPVRVSPTDADPANEVGQVGSAFNHMLGNVEGALASRQASETKVRQFVADASHELRNPLAAIRGYAELTRRHRDQVPTDTAFAMARVESEAERMSRLVEDMLLLARMDSNPNLQLEPVNLNDLLLNAISDAQAANSAYDWGVDLPEPPVIARADRHRLHQVVANLLANARKHTPEGTVVTVGTRLQGDQAVITVADNGPGIPPQIIDHVFERFTRADVARTRSGTSKDSTGLGLAIVQAVMEAHRGSASVESEPGRTVFTLRLPAA
ncbi:two-component sensor histidine kinase [Enemella evansiae]|uniref:sensor histidine kinase n=1 Tax=Enemella evansiae TaxID=2016499 RepID=UPI000B966AAC|nr:HAMP domain-containing sensor histidine kinase [Enemella evansiae]OYO13780.1 two-component sensor histidine kinase [Enemella evansiae]